MQTVNKRQYFIYTVFILGLLALCAALWYGSNMTIKNDQVKELPDALDVAFDFYDAWLDEVQANGGKMKTDSILFSSTAIEKGVRDSLLEKLNGGNEGVDPALCQVIAPDKIKMKYVHEMPTEVEMMVISDYATGTPSGFALVQMKVQEQSWVITTITCSKGDVLAEREFTFDTKGQLLKASVPAPFDNSKWHLVFSENNTPGHVAALQFTAASTCQNNGATTACDQNTLKEAAYAEVKGTMTETGVDVSTLTWSEAAF